jgi:hypothetical protein
MASNTSTPKARTLSIRCNGETCVLHWTPSHYESASGGSKVGSKVKWDNVEQCEDCGQTISEDSACTGSFVVCGCGASYACRPFAYSE